MSNTLFYEPKCRCFLSRPIYCHASMFAVKNQSMAPLLLLMLLAVFAAVTSEDPFIGVNIGTELSDMPNPTQVVLLLKRQQIRHVRLFDVDHGLLTALAKSGIQVIVSIPNDQLMGIGLSNSTAANWVSRNILAYYPDTNITAISVGSEVFTALPNAATVLVNALNFIQSALVASNLDGQIKVSTPIPSSIILDSFPPSQAFFNSSWKPVLVPMLKYLQSTGSFLMFNVYPYYDYMLLNGTISIDYALIEPLPSNKEAVDTNTLLRYSNLFDAMIDAVYFAMADLNFTNIPVVVTETGWPSKGDSSEPDATPDNAKTYNSNLIKHVMNKEGTPKHPGLVVNTFIYELYNEDNKPGQVSERNWGLFDANGEPVYILQVGPASGKSNGTANQTYCTAKEGADPKMLQAGLDWACGPGKVNCSTLLQGGQCYEPDNVAAHASYAFNAYYRKEGMTPDACNFKGVAAITTSDPSHGSCAFQGSGGRNGTIFSVNGTVPSMNSTSSSPPHSFYGSASATATAVTLITLLWSAICL
ncbi:glucan endo-1,3-beta-glucosidase 2-like isoform X2 [Malania oleifera]|uniref:glucan endo-1,3-beta-glucosidase 2-like isoform X2 n=1 Tax=Malania oleifera TaxID=397392 RepID=UPI0025ADE227|nr:glucan endo-1,3-beta-glucosidase 2-like isoform X2 [Malania oleifera]